MLGVIMSDVDIIDAKPITTPEVIVANPAMLEFMRGLLPVEIPDTQELADWQADDWVREQVDVPLTKFWGWIDRIEDDFCARGGLTQEDLGHLIREETFSGNNKIMHLHHDATGMEGAGHDESEAASRLIDNIISQLKIWQEDEGAKPENTGFLARQAKLYAGQLAADFREKFREESAGSADVLGQKKGLPDQSPDNSG
jgi:hypothetical protein